MATSLDTLILNILLKGEERVATEESISREQVRQLYNVIVRQVQTLAVRHLEEHAIAQRVALSPATCALLVEKLRKEDLLSSAEQHAKRRTGRDDRSDRIRQYYSLHVQAGKTIEEIARERNVRETSVYGALRRYGLFAEYYTRHPPKSSETHAALQAMVQAGKTIDEIANERGTLRGNVYSILRYHGLLTDYFTRHPKKPTSDEVRTEYAALIAAGDSIEQIAEKHKSKPASVYAALSSYGLLAEYRKHHPSNRSGITIERVQAYIEQGLSVAEIASRFNVSRQNIDYYLRKHNLHNQWKTVRDRRKQEQHEMQAEERGQRQHLVSLLAQMTLQKAQGDKALEKATQYALSLRRYDIRPSTFNQYYRLFQEYYTAQERGEKRSVMELAEASDISVTHISNILRAVGEAPMYYGAIQRHPLTPQQKQLIRKTFTIKTSLPYTILAQIIGVQPHHFTFSYYRQGRKKKQPSPTRLCQVGFLGAGGEVISHTSAFDLYAAVNAGFTKEEAMEYAGIKTDNGYDAALAKRKKAEREVRKVKRALGIK